MRSFTAAFCLIVTLSFVVFAQDLNNKTTESENIAVSEKISKVGKESFDKLLITKTEFEKDKTITKPQTSNSDFNKNEFFVGYSYQNVGDLDVRNSFNGFNGSYVRNVSRYFGIKADVSGAYKLTGFQAISLNSENIGNIEISRKNNASVYNFLGGVQVKDNASTNRLKPFAHALVGVGHNRNKLRTVCTSGDCPNNILINRTFTDTGFAGAFGGGLDIKINEKFDFRIVQIDYNPIYSNSRVDNNVRIGVGIVIK